MKSHLNINTFGLFDSEIWRRIPTLCLFTLIGIVIGYLVLRFPLTHVMALILGTAFVVLSIKKIELPLCLFVFLVTLFYEETSWGIFQYLRDINYPGIPSLLEILGGVLLLSFAVRLLIRSEKKIIPPLNLPLIGYLGLLGLALFIGLQNGNSSLQLKEEFKTFLLPVLFFICCVNLLNSERRIRLVLIFVFVAAFIKSSLGNIYYLGRIGLAYDGGPMNFFRGAGDQFVFMASIIVLISMIIYRKIRGAKLALTLLAVSPMLFALIFSYRRHAWLGFIISLLILFLLVPGSRKFKIFTIGTCAGLVVLFLISFANLMHSTRFEASLYEKFISIFEGRQTRTIDFRLKEWTITIEDTMEHPIMGLGLGSAHRPVGRGEQAAELPVTIVHNAFLLLWMKMGIFAVFLFMWYMMRFAILGLRAARAKVEHNLKPLQIGLFASFGFWAVAWNAAPTWAYFQDSCMIALAMAVIINLSKKIIFHKNYL